MFFFQTSPPAAKLWVSPLCERWRAGRESRLWDRRVGRVWRYASGAGCQAAWISPWAFGRLACRPRFSWKTLPLNWNLYVTVPVASRSRVLEPVPPCPFAIEYHLRAMRSVAPLKQGVFFFFLRESGGKTKRQHMRRHGGYPLAPPTRL